MEYGSTMDEQVECRKIGTIGHTTCGWCLKHDRPRHECDLDCAMKLVPLYPELQDLDEGGK